MYRLCIPQVFPHAVTEQQSEYEIVFTDIPPGYSFILAVWTGSTIFKYKNSDIITEREHAVSAEKEDLKKRIKCIGNILQYSTQNCE